MSSEEVSGMTDANLVVAIARCRREALAEASGRHGGKVFGLALRPRRAPGAGLVGAQVREARVALPAAERRAVALAFLAGNTYREVACLLGDAKVPSKAASARGCAVCASP